MILMGAVTDKGAFIARYASKLPPVYEKYDGHYLGMGGTHKWWMGEFRCVFG
ncbi:hypothetical protein [Hyphomonas sp.]|jgi:uncharacterized protein (DUF1330 family)|uniref:hypothetical protein n=1 Tax=Hyphomonas sp. TaxID=87 RepID=UPI001DCB8A67|nr:hypothetical protein [Hyphomonas sp.]